MTGDDDDVLRHSSNYTHPRPFLGPSARSSADSGSRGCDVSGSTWI